MVCSIPKSEPTSILTLHIELRVEIISYLHPTDAVCLGLTCKNSYSLHRDLIKNKPVRLTSGNVPRGTTYRVRSTNTFWGLGWQTLRVDARFPQRHADDLGVRLKGWAGGADLAWNPFYSPHAFISKGELRRRKSWGPLKEFLWRKGCPIFGKFGSGSWPQRAWIVTDSGEMLKNVSRSTIEEYELQE